MKIIIALLFASSSVMACPAGYFEYKDTCAADLKPYTAKPVQPSDEKPPSDKMPSYQREGVNVVAAPSMVADDEKQDQDKRDATAEGKRKAGIK